MHSEKRIENAKNKKFFYANAFIMKEQKTKQQSGLFSSDFLLHKDLNTG